MYLEHYGLKEPPFSITPDPRFVFLSERHRDALAHLLFGIDKGGGGGFVQLTGEVGTGKTTLSRLLLEQLPESTRVALVLNPRLSPVELLETICEELHLDLEGKRGSLKSLVDVLNGYLLDAYARGLRVVLIIDEAQNLSLDALEQVRLLTNLETDTQKLLQIILLGQPELRDMLARADMRQLAQRITARYHLTPLNDVETASYLRHRYRVAGGLHLPFDAAAIQRIHAHSGGVPRLINVIAERALLGGYAHDLTTIDAHTVNRAAREALAPTASRWTVQRLAVPTAAAFVIAAVAAAFWSRPQAPGVQPASATTAVPAKVAAPAPRVRTPVLDGDAFNARLLAADAPPTSAWQQLLTLWNLPADAGAAAAASACAPSIAPGVYCLRGRARLDKLTAQDRPVLLRLRSAEREAWAVLLGADAIHVRLWLDGQGIDTDRITLDRVWNGEYAAVWRGPSDLIPPLPADGPGMEWVRDRLAPRYVPDDAPAVLDAAMREAVRRFQTEGGLLSDGVIGPETLMALAAGDEGPKLQRVLE